MNKERATFVIAALGVGNRILGRWPRDTRSGVTGTKSFSRISITHLTLAVLLHSF